MFLKTLNTKAQEYEVSLKIKINNVCIAISSLVMSLSSRDHLMRSSCIINHGSSLTYTAPGF